MENASKALIMAAGVLIGILILSLAVFLFANFGAASAEVHKENEENRIEQFNVQFTAYQGRADVTIHDIITVANLAKSSNESFGLTVPSETNYYITVNARTSSGSNYNLEKKKTSDLEGLVKIELNNLVDRVDDDGVSYKGLPTYNCEVTINENTKRVSEVNFTINK